MDKEKTSVNQEKEAFLEKVKKIPDAVEVILPVLKKFTDKESWEFSEDEEKTIIFGKDISFDQVNPPIIEVVLSKKRDFLFLNIFRNENDFLRKENKSARLTISSSGIDTKKDFVVRKSIMEDTDLSNPYKRLLFQIGGFISSLIDELESKKIQ